MWRCVGRASLDAASAWALRRVQERGRRAEPDPRGVLSASRHPATKVLRGSSIARRGVGLGIAASPGTRASGGARPTGVFSASRHPAAKVLRGSSIARRGVGLGIAASPGPRASGGARPTGVFSAPMLPMAKTYVGRAIARRGDGLGTAASPGTQASGEARPTGVVFSVAASSGEGPSWVEHRSTRRRLGHCDESRTAGVGRSPTHGGCFQGRGIQWRGLSWVEQ